MLEKLKQNKEIFYSVVLIALPVVLLFSVVIVLQVTARDAAPAAHTIPVADTVLLPNVFADITIEAKAAIVKDLNTGAVLYEKNSQIPLPLASITKVLTALTFEMSGGNEVVSISPIDVQTEGDSLIYPGEKFRKNDLINFTLITSSNDASAALAANALGSMTPIPSKQIFIQEMNRIAQQIGMKDSYFYNETGLDSSNTTAGAHGSASDVATLFEYTLKHHPDVLENTNKSTMTVVSLNGLLHRATNTNEIVDQLPNVVASKTGFTDLAGGNLAVVIDPALNRPVVIVVLGSSESGRFKDVELLAEKTEEYFSTSSEQI